MTEYELPEVWGPHFWFVMRCVANDFPDKPTVNDKHHVKEFYGSLQYVLPCDKCRNNYKKHCAKFPIDHWLENKMRLCKWVEIIYDETEKDIQKEIDSNAEKRNQEDEYKQRKREINEESRSVSKRVKYYEVKKEVRHISLAKKSSGKKKGGCKSCGRR